MKQRIVIGALFLIGGAMILRNMEKPKGIRNNNPLDIRVSGDEWQGKTGDDGEFFQFESPVFGIRAAARTLRTYREKHGLNTVSGIINRWAPPSENLTGSYIESVANKIKLDAHETLRDEDYPRLIEAMIFHENGEQPYSAEIIQDGFKRGFYS